MHDMRVATAYVAAAGDEIGEFNVIFDP